MYFIDHSLLQARHSSSRALVGRGSLNQAGVLTETAWKNASEQCAENVVCIVPAGEAWLLSANMTVDALKIEGIFKWDDTVPGIVLTIGWLNVEPGGNLKVGSAIAPIGAVPGVTATIYIKRTAINQHPVHGDRFLNGNGSTIDIHGLPMARTWCLLNRTARAGSTELFLNFDPSAMGWKVGDRIGLATTSMGTSTKHQIVAIREATDEPLVLASAVAGQQEAQLPASNTIDDNMDSLWSSYLAKAEENWIVFNFSVPHDLTRFRFYWQEPRYAPQYLVEVQHPGSEKWTTAANVTNGYDAGEIALSEICVRAVRMVAAYAPLWNRGYNGKAGTEPAWSGLWLKEAQFWGRATNTKLPTVIVLDTPVLADHLGGLRELEGRTFEMAAEVVNLERTVLVTGDHEDFYESLQGYSTAMMDSGLMDVRYARFEFCGRRDFLGMYCLHLHMCKSCPECVIQGNAVVDGQQVGITIHDTHQALIDNNVVWDARAAGIHTEDGNEMNNIISNNVLICSFWTVCAVPWLGKVSGLGAGIFLIGMTNDLLYNRVIGYDQGLYTPGSAFQNGQGAAWGKVCPQNMPFGTFRGNVCHDNPRYGIYLDNQYPRNLKRDINGYVVGGCPQFDENGKDNGVTPPNLIEDHFDWHNTFNGQYSMGDISYVRYISVNNGHSMYWKTSKNFADGVSHHVIDSIFANDPRDSIGQLQVYGPSGPFTFKFTNNSFLGGPVGTAALCAGQHCGLGGAGGPCNVQYLLEGVNWSGLMRSQKRIQFGVNTASFGQVQPIFLAKDDSLGGFRSMVSQHLNGFANVGCTQQDYSWDSGFACDQPIRRLNFWVLVDQGNLKLSGPGYDNVDINYAYPVLGLNAGVMQMEPMHKGYGLPVLAGGSYTVFSDAWRGGVAVEFSDPEVAEYFGVTDHLSLKVVNGTTCNLSSGDPRNFLTPLGLNGQASTMSLEGLLTCFIQGEVLPDMGVGGSSGGGSSGGGAEDHTGVHGMES
mmetsp:Transcript_117680/g.377616  ORF Transcript_117680/g.377616 Transcript_117680/m.377616 type:complete len:988 (+) Transcript_117680:2-2965(+)